jgi:medium-chain acyl-[acyl-carrier-protein] hydrolase
MQPIAEYKYLIRSYQTDSNRRLFIHQLFNLLQDVAHRHADGLGFGMPQLLDQGLFWVLSRLTVQIERLPKHEDEVIISTWVKGSSGVKSEREFTIALNDQIIIRASSLWFCLAAANHRPVAIPETLIIRMQPHDVYGVNDGAKKLSALPKDEPMTEGMHIEAQDSDIDMVKHVNNAVYVRWIIDETRRTYPSAAIKELTINYLNEAYRGEQVVVSHIKEQEDVLAHQIIKHKDQSLVCRSQIILY